MRRLGSVRSCFDLRPQLRLGARVEDVEREAAHVLQRGARAQLADDRERRDLPHGGVAPRPGEFEHELPVLPGQLVFGQLEIGEPGQKLRAENLAAAVEGVAGEPDQLLLGEADGARVVELLAQLLLVDLLGELDALRAVDQREGRLHLRVDPADHLQHQKLVEIRIQDRANDRIELPGVVVDPLGDVGDGHAAVLADQAKKSQAAGTRGK